MSENWLIAIGCQVPKLDKQDKLFISVPGELVCSLHITLPQIPAKNQEQVIGYAIEDKIASHLDSVKLFSNPRHKGGMTPVLWCLRENWESWMKQMETLNKHVPKSMLPDYLYLPLEEESWSIRSVQGRSLLRCSLSTGLTIETQSFIGLLTLKLDNTADLPASLIYDGDELTDELTLICQQYGILFTHKKLRLFESPSSIGLSLLPKNKFDWTQFKPSLFKQFSPPWRIASGLLSVWLVVFAVGATWHHAVFNKAQINVEQALAAVYHRTYPSHSVPGNIAKRLQHLQRSLRKGLNKSPMLAKLKNIALAKKASPGLKIESFDATTKHISLKISARSISMIDHFTQQLKVRKTSTKQSNLLITPDGVTVTLTLGGSA